MHLIHRIALILFLFLLISLEDLGARSVVLALIAAIVFIVVPSQDDIFS